MGAPRDELDWLHHLHERLPPGPPGEVWVGDDAAVLSAVDGSVLFTIDSAVAGVHADLELVGLDDFGWKALARAVSDVAAMGGDAWRAVVAVSGPAGVDIALLYDGVAAAAAAFDCPVVGGDLSSATELIVTVAVTGVVPAGEPGPVTRSGAGPGDRVWVTGPLGRAAAGLRLLQEPGSSAAGEEGVRSELTGWHRRPHPRLAAGRTARRCGATAMIDVSDGFAIDTARLAEASGLAIELADVPVATGATADDAMGGGEDYELVICAPAQVDLAEVFTAGALPPPIEVGGCAAGTPGELRRDGRRLPVPGWRHWRAG